MTAAIARKAVILITGSSGVSWQTRTAWIVVFYSDIAKFVTAFPERFGMRETKVLPASTSTPASR